MRFEQLVIDVDNNKVLSASVSADVFQSAPVRVDALGEEDAVWATEVLSRLASQASMTGHWSLTPDEDGYKVSNADTEVRWSDVDDERRAAVHADINKLLSAWSGLLEIVD